MMTIASIWLFCLAVFVELVHRAPLIESWDE
jgi:hypothetical protein